MKDGHLMGCVIACEEPAGSGFAEATLSLAKKFKTAAVGADGKGAGGGEVTIPIHWESMEDRRDLQVVRTRPARVAGVCRTAH